MSRNIDGLRVPTHLFEAAVWRYNIRVSCPMCRKSAVFEAVGLWYRFHQKRWDDDLRNARDKLWCKPCSHRLGKRVRPRKLELTKEGPATRHLPDPSDIEWKNALSRFRA